MGDLKRLSCLLLCMVSSARPSSIDERLKYAIANSNLEEVQRLVLASQRSQSRVNLLDRVMPGGRTPLEYAIAILETKERTPLSCYPGSSEGQGQAIADAHRIIDFLRSSWAPVPISPIARRPSRAFPPGAGSSRVCTIS